jgi:CBS domain-containing protein
VGLLKLGQPTLEVKPDATVLDAVRVLVDGNQGALVVAEGKKVLGIFTERDLMRRVVATGKDPATTRIRDVMTHPVLTVQDSMSVAGAATMMREHNLRHLPIVDDAGSLLGMCALRFLLYATMDELELKVGDLSRFIMTDGPGG